jgi:WD40 repeat protein
MIRCLFLCLLALLQNYSRAQLADYWIDEAVEGSFKSATSLVWDTSGQLLFLARDDHEKAQVFRTDPRSGLSEQLTNDTISKTALSFNHETGKLLISSGTDGHRKIIQITPGVSAAVPLIPRQLQQIQAHVNTNGTMAAFIGKDSNERHWNLYTYDFTYNNLNKLSADEADFARPMWSPNAELLGFEIKLAHEKHTKIRVIHWYGKPHIEINDSEYDVKYPSWSPNSQWIAYVLENFTGSKLMICRKNGDDKTLVYESPYKISYPVWSESGESIAFLLHDSTGQTRLIQLFQM